jgi:1,4-alpha-glucan branching enzyme
MKCLVTFVSIFVVMCCDAQLLTWSPDFIQESSTNVTITCDASKGNKGLFNYTPVTDVYVHIGCITTLSSNASDWKYVPYAWGTTNALAKCTSLGNNKWQFVINGALRSFFGITNASEKIVKIAILFRSGNGNSKLANADGGDMYIPVYDNSLAVRIDTPFRQPGFVMTPETAVYNVGDPVSINAKSNQSSNLQLFYNGSIIATRSGATTLSATTSITAPGTQTIVAVASSGTVSTTDTFSFFVTSSVNVAALPAGVKDGINYETGDTSVTLVLFAPLKNSIYVLGDFNNWSQQSKYQMSQTPDGSRFWLRITGLTPGTEYAYQFLIDGSLKVADYSTEKILDPSNDGFIPAVTYPSLKSYPTGKTTGIVSILQTAKPTYNWQVTNFNRPDKRNLVIYELLLRDFVAAQNWQTLKDTLSYIKRLGVNAIEVMPFNEFEGNNSWGYNPIFYFAPDKAYGTETALKQFIDECHKQGIAVIMDMVLNHSFGQSPMVQMYWDAVNSRPAANSPWFNQVATHPYSVGYDFNHESQATKDFVDRVVTHWLVNYKIDGFRWDLSKGFTQTNNPNDVTAWGLYDASRIAIWKRIYDKMQSVSSNAYCILEHFAVNQEETELSDYGMLLWGNGNYNFNQATMGYSTDWNFESGIFKNRGWSKPNLVTYMESHDEERLMYKNITYGNSNSTYNVKDLNTALKRNEMAAAFWAMIPGPKLLWQFGELGYDFTINRCEDGTIDANNCRTSPKPVRWDYKSNSNRLALYNVYSQLIALKLAPNFISTFTTSNVTYDLSAGLKWLKLDTDSLKVVVAGNFDVAAATASITFPAAGTWYSYLTGSTRTATGSAENITLQPGEYYVYTNRNLRNNIVTAVNTITNNGTRNTLSIFPDPVLNDAIIHYELSESSKVLLEVWDMQGKKLATLLNDFKSKGTYQFNLKSNSFNPGKLPSGTYLLHIAAKGGQETIPFLKSY